MTEHKTNNPVGRPRTTLEDLPENWEQILLAAGQEGASALEMRCLLGISDTAWETLCTDYEQFSRTVKNSKDMCQVWWEKCGRNMSAGHIKGNAVSWMFNMSNRFNWHNKQNVEHTGRDGAPIQQVTTVVSKEDVKKVIEELENDY